MSDKQALIDLRNKVRAGEAPEYRPFREAYVETCWRAFEMVHRRDAFSAYNGSLNAAKALHEAVLGDGYIGGGYKYCIWGNGTASVFNVMSGNRGYGEVPEKEYHAVSPARAWLLAILGALISEQSNG